jgi:hypothetical protein
MHVHPSCRITFSVDGKQISAWAHSHEHLSEICDVVLRLLAVSGVHSVTISRDGRLNLVINAPSLVHLLEQCKSLKGLTLGYLTIDENHCRVLGAYSRPGLDIELVRCAATSAGTSALVEVLGSYQGPTKLVYCNMDNLLLANALRGNTSLKSLTMCDVNGQKLLAVADSLRENKGLIELDLTRCNFRENEETWGAICDSLKTHPTLEVLKLSYRSHTDTAITFRLQEVLDMIKVNNSIHTIGLSHCYKRHELFRGSVIPYLKTNRYRPRLLAIQKTQPINFRVKILGRALHAARKDTNSPWMLLSGNAEVYFPATATSVNDKLEKVLETVKTMVEQEGKLVAENKALNDKLEKVLETVKTMVEQEGERTRSVEAGGREWGSECQA